LVIFSLKKQHKMSVSRHRVHGSTVVKAWEGPIAEAGYTWKSANIVARDAL